MINDYHNHRYCFHYSFQILNLLYIIYMITATVLATIHQSSIINHQSSIFSGHQSLFKYKGSRPSRIFTSMYNRSRMFHHDIIQSQAKNIPLNVSKCVCFIQDTKRRMVLYVIHLLILVKFASLGTTAIRQTVQIVLYAELE